MFIYVSRNYTATASETAVRAVLCERCGGEYFYSQYRFVTGKASAAYGIGGQLAARRAQDRAAKALDRTMGNSADPVPCPHCGWLQTSMVRFVRRQRLAWLQRLAWAL